MTLNSAGYAKPRVFYEINPVQSSEEYRANTLRYHSDKSYDQKSRYRDDYEEPKTLLPERIADRDYKEPKKKDETIASSMDGAVSEIQSIVDTEVRNIIAEEIANIPNRI